MAFGLHLKSKNYSTIHKAKQNMSNFLNTKLLTLAQKSLDFRTKRQDLLASNIANKDTPGYQAEDLVFEKNLKQALNADQPGHLQITDVRHMDGNNTPPLQITEPQRIRSAAPFVSFNGNTVDLDKEMAKMAENQLMYNATTRVISHQFKALKTAISEGR